MRTWSWSASPAEAEARRSEARELVGQRIREVRYYTIDYERHALHPELAGPRRIVDEAERAAPTWLYPGFDAMDYGFELVTDEGATFSVTWDPPGDREGIGLQRLPMLGTAVIPEAQVAIWQVSDHAWAPMIGRLVTEVDLHYLPWLDAGLWCPHITLHGEEGRVEVLLGDAEDDVLVPSSDNVAVLHPGTPFPNWHEQA